METCRARARGDGCVMCKYALTAGDVSGQRAVARAGERPTVPVSVGAHADVHAQPSTWAWSAGGDGSEVVPPLRHRASCYAFAGSGCASRRGGARRPVRWSP